jgi:hypothetical protein
MKPGLLLRLEAAFVLAGCIALYAMRHDSWGLFAVLFLAPDLAILAYKAGVRVGAPVYNAVHTYVGPFILFIFPVTRPYALIWGAHIALDRLLGFGLKYPTNFKDTHLQRLAILFCVFVPGRSDAQWPIKTREHVDLWLTAFAELSTDTTDKVPVYRRDYLDQLALAQNQQSILTSLDSVHDGLQAHWDQAPKLAGARALALDAGTWEEMQSAIDLYLNPPTDKKHSKAVIPDVESHLADYFSTPGDRDWLRELDHGLQGARQQFYHGWWVAEERRRRPILVATDSLWRLTEPKLDRFLAATHQTTGEIILAMPVDGAGVTFKEPSGRTSLAVPFPDSAADAVQVIYVFAQVAARAVAADAIAAGTTVAERRAGTGDRYAEALAIRGGYMLLAKAAPELAEGYARYYLRTSPAGRDLAAAFPLPDAIRDALSRQIDLELK